MPYELRTTSLFMPFSHDFYLPIHASSLFKKPLSNFIDIPSNSAKFIMINIVWDTNPTHTNAFDVICNLKTPSNYEICGMVCGHGFLYNAYGRGFHDNWKSFGDGKILSWSNVVWGMISTSFYPVVVMLKKCDSKSIDTIIKTNEVESLEKFCRLQDERIKIIFTETIDKDRKHPNTRINFTENEDRSKPEETQPINKYSHTTNSFLMNSHEQGLKDKDEKLEGTNWGYKPSRILTEVSNDYGYSSQTTGNNSKNYGKTGQSSSCNSQNQSRYGQSTYASTQNTYNQSENSFSNGRKDYFNGYKPYEKEEKGKESYRYERNTGQNKGTGPEGSVERYSRWAIPCSDNDRNRFYSTGPENFYKGPTTNEGYSTSRNYAEDLRSSAYALNLNSSELKNPPKVPNSLKPSENFTSKSYYPESYNSPTTPPHSKPQDKYFSAQKNPTFLDRSGDIPKNLNKTLDNFSRSRSPSTFSYRIEDSNKEQMPEIKLTGLKTPGKCTPLRHNPVTQDPSSILQQKAVKLYSSQYEQRIPIIKSEEVIKHSFADWKCPKCSGVNIRDSYECSGCRYINWEKFYAIKAITAVPRSESIPARGVDNSDTYKKNWRIPYDVGYTEKNLEFKGVASKDAWSSKQNQNIFMNDDRKKVPAFAYSRYDN